MRDPRSAIGDPRSAIGGRRTATGDRLTATGGRRPADGDRRSSLVARNLGIQLCLLFASFACLFVVYCLWFARRSRVVARCSVLVARCPLPVARCSLASPARSTLPPPVARQWAPGHRVSRPRDTGSVGDSVGEGAHWAGRLAALSAPGSRSKALPVRWQPLQPLQPLQATGRTHDGASTEQVEIASPTFQPLLSAGLNPLTV